MSWQKTAQNEEISQNSVKKKNSKEKENSKYIKITFPNLGL